MTEEEKVKRTRGMRGKAKTPIWHYHNKITGIEKDYLALPEIANELQVCEKTVYNLAHGKPVKNGLLKQIYDSITITRIKKK